MLLLRPPNVAARHAILLIILSLAAAASSLTAQQTSGIITGKVIDRQSQRPLGATQIRVSGSARGAQTDDAGNYRITGVPVGTVNVVAQRIGYGPVSRSVAVTAGGIEVADFALIVSATQLDQVVVTATGQTERKRENGATTASIDSSMINKAVVSTFADVLSSRAPGVVVQQSAGETGAGARIRIRGSNSISLSNDPLIIVDGVRIDNSANSTAQGTGGQQPSRFNDLNPEEIENIEVIKGPAAAALYGTAASNGVIQITTRKGRAGKTKWQSFADMGTLHDINVYPSNYRSFGHNAAGAFVANCSLISRASTSATKCVAVDSTVTNNPIAVAGMESDGQRRIAGLNAAGGSDVVTYFISGEYQREQNVFLVNAQQKMNLRTNIRGELTKNLTSQVSIGYTNSDLRRPQNDNNAFGVVSGALLGKAVDCGPGGLNTRHPTLCGTDTLSRGYFNPGLDPKAFYNINTRQQVQRLIGGMTTDWTPLNWLSINSTLGADIDNRNDNETLPPGVLPYDQTRFDGYRSVLRALVVNYTTGLNAQAVWNPSSSVKLTSTVGSQYSDVAFSRTDATGFKLLAGTSSLAGTNARFSVNEVSTDVRTLGFIGREQIAWRDRVFLTGGVRTDRNSAFGDNFSRVYYPSVSASWVISEESLFPKSLSAITSLRLRSAYGSAGQNPGFLAAEQYYNPVAVVINGQDTPGFTIAGAGNPDLKPEKSTEWEGGFDAGLLHDRINLEYTHFTKVTRDALVNVNLAPSLGTSAQRFQNLGRVKNYGDEAQLRVNVLDGEKVGFEFTLNGTWTTNRLEDLGVDPLGKPIPDIFFNGGTQAFKAGLPLGGYFQRSITGFGDKNGDGLIGCPNGYGSADCEVSLSDSSVYLGNPFPAAEITFAPSLTLGRNLRIQATLDHRGGQKLFNNTAYFRDVSIGNGEAVQLPTSANLERQAAITAARFSGRAFTYAGYIESSSFTKLREVAVSLTLPQQLAARAHAGNATLTLAGRNLKSWSKYSGIDPELNSSAQAQFTTSDFLTAPQVRTFTARLTLGF